MSNHDGVPGAPAGSGDVSQPPAPGDEQHVPAPQPQSQEPQQQPQQTGPHPDGPQNPAPSRDRFGGPGAAPQQDPSAARVGGAPA